MYALIYHYGTWEKKLEGLSGDECRLTSSFSPLPLIEVVKVKGKSMTYEKHIRYSSVYRAATILLPLLLLFLADLLVDKSSIEIYEKWRYCDFFLFYFMICVTLSREMTLVSPPACDTIKGKFIIME